MMGGPIGTGGTGETGEKAGIGPRDPEAAYGYA
jgi:hypothetical protein